MPRSRPRATGTRRDTPPLDAPRASEHRCQHTAPDARRRRCERRPLQQQRHSEERDFGGEFPFAHFDERRSAVPRAQDRGADEGRDRRPVQFVQVPPRRASAPSELTVMTSRLVPTAARIRSPSRPTSAGTARNPPPTPRTPGDRAEARAGPCRTDGPGAVRPPFLPARSMHGRARGDDREGRLQHGAGNARGERGSCIAGPIPAAARAVRHAI